MYKLSNEQITIGVKEHGAELASIIYNGREYLWQADPEFWARHSPVLFPIVGSVWNKQFRSQGRTYPMGQHGFARDTDFTFKSQTTDTIFFELKSSEETLAKYPYEFSLEIGYKLVGKSIQVIWKITNPSSKEMYFQIGAHPAFHWPLLSTETIAAGTAAMKDELAKSENRGYFQLFCGDIPCGKLRNSLIKEAACVDPINTSDIETAYKGFLALDTHTFDGDALVFENSQVDKVVLCDEAQKPYLAVKYNAPVIGLWSPPAKNAPFVCIEPWYGRADDVQYDGLYESKKWIQHLAAGAVFEGGYTIELF